MIKHFKCCDKPQIEFLGSMVFCSNCGMESELKEGE